MNTQIGNKAARLGEISKIVHVRSFMTIDVADTQLIREAGSIPRHIQEALQQFQIARRDGFAVRSSGVLEDGEEKSLAGKHRSILNVKAHDLQRAIIECAQGDDLAIIVQMMVNADYSGAILTVDATGEAPCAIIAAVPGLSEDLMAGRVTGARYIVNLATDTVEDIEGGDILPRDVLQLILYEIRKIIAHYKCDQEIEWAYEEQNSFSWDSGVYINQVRPVTASENANLTRLRAIMSARRELVQERDRLESFGMSIRDDVLSDQNIAEILTQHPTEMTFGLFNYLFAGKNGAIATGRRDLGYAIGEELDSGLFCLIGGQPRNSIVHDALTYRIEGIPLTEYEKMVREYLSQIANDEKYANYPEVNLYVQDPSLDYLGAIFGEKKAVTYRKAYDRFFKQLRAAETDVIFNYEYHFLPSWSGTIESFDDMRIDDLSVLDLVGQFYSMCEHLRLTACPMFVRAARIGFFAYARLRTNMARLYDLTTAQQYVNILTRGVSYTHSPSTRFTMHLYQLKQGTASLEQLIDCFGHLSEHELALEVPRYGETPEILLALAEKIKEPPVDRFTDHVQETRNLANKVVDEHGTANPDLRREILIAQQYLALRERAKFEYLRGYRVLRTIAVALGHKLGWEDDLIFNLPPEQVFKLLGNEKEMEKLAKKARKQRKEHMSLYVPPVLKSTDLGAIGRAPASGSSDKLHGIGVTNATTEGICVVIESLADKDAIASLESGAIVVTTTADPGWAPVLETLGETGGFVTEVGGPLAHVAQIGRELNIATVLNVPNATRILQTGMKIRVNGLSGLVEIL